jgi:hypothetical protein
MEGLERAAVGKGREPSKSHRILAQMVTECQHLFVVYRKGAKWVAALRVKIHILCPRSGGDAAPGAVLGRTDASHSGPC